MYGTATFYGTISADNMYATAQYDDDELFNNAATNSAGNANGASPIVGTPSLDSCVPSLLDSSSDDEFDDFSDEDNELDGADTPSLHARHDTTTNNTRTEAKPVVSPFPTTTASYGILGDSHDNLYMSTPDYEAPPPPTQFNAVSTDPNSAYSDFHEEELTDELPIEKPDYFHKVAHRKRTNSRIVVQKPSVISGGSRRQVQAISEWKDARIPLSIGNRTSSTSIAVRLRNTGEAILGNAVASSTAVPSSPQHQSGSPALTRDWNADFQEILDIPNDSPEKLGRLTKLAQEFTSMAVTYATIIITELCLPNDLKTVRPADMGGTAGGQKFVVQGILFKIALDVQLGPGMYMYGDKEPRNEFAMKAAAKELNGLGALWASSNVEGICGPLMTIVDYKGFRIVAMSLLPIGKDTIRYGSADGGITVHADDPFLNKQLKAFAKPYHLKKHLVGKDLAARALYLPGDIEGHHGYDDRYYLLDFARLMPPEGPSTDPKSRDKHKRAVFYRTLRPEYLRFQVKKPLCSDAFTFFDSSSKSQQARHRRDIMEATNHLFTSVIPEYTRSLEGRLEKLLQERGGFDTICNNSMDAAELLVLTTGTYLHPRGLNIRHLGRVRKATSNPITRKVVLSSICARLVKNMINKRMRDTMNQVRAPADAPFEEDIVQVFNLLLGTSKASTWFWQEELLPEIEDSFPEALSGEEREPTFVLSSAVDLRLIFTATLSLMNISLSPQANDDLFLFLRLNDHSQEFQFVVGDITQLGMRLRTLPVVYFCEAMQTFQRVSPTMNLSTKMRILLRAEQAFTKTILTIPFCPIITNQFAKLYLYMADLSVGPARDRYYSNAFQKFSTTIFDLGYEFHESLELWSAALRKYAKEEREFGREEHAKQLESDAVDVESRFEQAWGKKGECSGLFRGIANSVKPAEHEDPEAGKLVE